MSRMTKYLKQTALLEKVRYDEFGKPIMDIYGEYTYDPPVSVKCRKEPSFRNYNSSTGQYEARSGKYYTDDAIPVRVKDLIDGKVVMDVYEYYDGAGTLVGYEVHV